MTEKRYVSPALGARAEVRISIRLADELDEWVRSQESLDWQRWDGRAESPATAWEAE